MKKAGQQVVVIAAWLVLMSAGGVLGGWGPTVEAGGAGLGGGALGGGRSRGVGSGDSGGRG